jgi:hypothetical protein
MMDDDSGDEHHPGLFDESVLDSLNKLTEEIHEDLRADNDNDHHNSVAAGGDCNDGYYSSDDDYDDHAGGYSDDDEDPESGENQLFSMMDDLVMELQMELKQSGEGEMLIPPIVDGQHGMLGMNEMDTSTPTKPSSPPLENNTENDRVIVVSPDPTSEGGQQGFMPPVDCTNFPSSHAPKHNNHSKSEKQLRLQQHVKSLLRRVADMASTNQDGSMNNTTATFTTDDNNNGDTFSTLECTDTTSAIANNQQPTADTGLMPTPNDDDPNLSFESSSAAGPQSRRRHSSGVDRLERLLGAISSYKSVRDPMNRTTSLEQGRGGMSNDEATNGDELVEETVAKADNDGGTPGRLRRAKTSREKLTDVTDDIEPAEPDTPKIGVRLGEDTDPVTTQDLAMPGQERHRRHPSSPTIKKKKTKQRTNKHKKRRPQRDMMQGFDGQQRLISEPAEPISQQSLRTLLASLLALDDKLSKETTTRVTTRW